MTEKDHELELCQRSILVVPFQSHGLHGSGRHGGLHCTCSNRRVPALRVGNDEQTPFACTAVHLGGTEVIILIRFNALGIEVDC